jgi:hypothetical protein
MICNRMLKRSDGSSRFRRAAVRSRVPVDAIREQAVLVEANIAGRRTDQYGAPYTGATRAGARPLPTAEMVTFWSVGSQPRGRAPVRLELSVISNLQ